MARKEGGLMAKVANMTAHSRGDHNKRIYSFLSQGTATGGLSSGVTAYDFTIHGYEVTIDGREVYI